MKIHKLKCWPMWYDQIERGEKTFEARVDDRGYEVGDILELRRWDPDLEDYTGVSMCHKVTSILHASGTGNAVRPGYCIMSIQPLEVSL